MDIVSIGASHKLVENKTDIFKDSPFPIPRKEQEIVIPLIVKELTKGTKNIVLELPTGTGKSAISYFIPHLTDYNAYIIAHLKGLQNQYVRELPMMDNVMGKGNYSCRLNIPSGCEDFELINSALEEALTTNSVSDSCSADLAPCSTSKDFNCPFKFSIGKSDSEGNETSVNSHDYCDYYSSLHSAFMGDYFLTNTSYLMSMWPLGVLPQRDLLIVDEAHNLSNSLMNHYSLTLSQGAFEKLFNIPSWNEIESAKGESKSRMKLRRVNLLKSWNPKDGNDAGFGIPSVPSIQVGTTNRSWELGSKVFKAYFTHLASIIDANLERKIYGGEQLKFATNFSHKIHRMISKLSDWKNWVWSKNHELNPSKITFKPLSIKKDAHNLIHSCAKQRIYMSATIGDIDVFCEELGLEPDDTTFIKLEYSPFPIDNRPIFTHIKGGSLTYKGKTEDDYFKTAKAVSEIAWKYKDKKGLILPYTKEIKDDLTEAINKYHPFIGGRLITHSDNPQEREECFNSFDASTSNDILVSTYANQGYDGKDVDFLIIVKLPFSSIADIQVKKKMDANPKWYKSKVATELTQMCGRIVRSKENVGHTYIIDPSFNFHYAKGINNQPLNTEIPIYVVESIENNR
tara:strand:+ start:8772 stop:10652 length:1881 start_codon:yes stop_codon:yes gene_type:complete